MRSLKKEGKKIKHKRKNMGKTKKKWLEEEK